MSENELIINTSDNCKINFKLPVNFDYLSIKTDFGERILCVQKNLHQKTNWISKPKVRDAIEKMKRDLIKISTNNETFNIIKVLNKLQEELNLGDEE